MADNTLNSLNLCDLILTPPKHGMHELKGNTFLVKKWKKWKKFEIEAEEFDRALHKLVSGVDYDDDCKDIINLRIGRSKYKGHTDIPKILPKKDAKTTIIDKKDVTTVKVATWTGAGNVVGLTQTLLSNLNDAARKKSDMIALAFALTLRYYSPNWKDLFWDACRAVFNVLEVMGKRTVGFYRVFPTFWPMKIFDAEINFAPDSPVYFMLLGMDPLGDMRNSFVNNATGMAFHFPDQTRNDVETKQKGVKNLLFHGLDTTVDIPDLFERGFLPVNMLRTIQGSKEDNCSGSSNAFDEAWADYTASFVFKFREGMVNHGTTEMNIYACFDTTSNYEPDVIKKLRDKLTPEIVNDFCFKHVSRFDESVNNEQLHDARKYLESKKTDLNLIALAMRRVIDVKDSHIEELTDDTDEQYIEIVQLKSELKNLGGKKKTKEKNILKTPTKKP
eukprot:m.64687 g.64687  ORF g.64687 m.64687 type:complete len:446 (-) comp23462_c0_seq2:455-1792(-)